MNITTNSAGTEAKTNRHVMLFSVHRKLAKTAAPKHARQTTTLLDPVESEFETLESNCMSHRHSVGEMRALDVTSDSTQ